MYTDTYQHNYRDTKRELEDIVQRDHNNKTKNNIHYLTEISKFTKEDVLQWWSAQVFDLETPEWLGNCVFCPKKSKLKVAAACHDAKELYKPFVDMLKSPSVRYDDKTGHYSKMYRGSQSLENLIMSFEGHTGKEIKQRIRGQKMLDTSSCSGSCEMFNSDL